MRVRRFDGIGGRDFSRSRLKSLRPLPLWVGILLGVHPMAATYNYWLVLVSIVVATIASYTALDLATRISASTGTAARTWLIGGACAMGVGIWSMHFIGMLAWSLPIPIGYHVGTTLLSLVIAIIVSGFALFTVTRKRLSLKTLGLGGVLMGAGICGMHYTGMAAIPTEPHVTYDPVMFAASVAIAIGASHAALWIAFSLRRGTGWMAYAKLAAAFVMGFAITGMHYTGMAAAHFAPDTICLTGPIENNWWLAGTITGATLMILTVTLVLSLIDARMSSKTALMAASLKRANDELQKSALHDALTKLPNRVLLEDRIDRAIAQASRSKVNCAVIFVDLDRFKQVNDSLGHFVGDELLRAVAKRLEGCVRAEDTVARIGGDEFVILMREVHGEAGAVDLASRVLKAMGEPVRVHEHKLYVTPSLGVAVYPEHGNTAQTLITHADAAMYMAKKEGRNAFRVFAPDMNTFFPERLMLENELRIALEERQFVLHYQPKVDVSTGALVGMEALLRWLHPRKGIVPPDQFIPLAEETGLIVPIGRWVLKDACRQNKEWQDAGMPPVRIAVNLSGVQFKQKDLVETVTTALAESGLDASCLELEITETVVMQDASFAIGTIEKLSAMGIHISIDDFGTGYSSLAYLKRFQVDKLKIDRSFIRDIASDADDASIVRATIGLAHNLRLRVVAEGVETQEQLVYLRTLGCDEYQGYYKSKPLTAEDFTRQIIRAEAVRSATIEGDAVAQPT